MDITKKDVQQVAGSLQVCAGQDAGAMTVIHTVCDLFQQDETKEVLLVDTESAFNFINRKAMLHNISITCPIVSTFVLNWYLVPVLNCYLATFYATHKMRKRKRRNTK